MAAILGLDTATAYLSVAVVRDGEIAAEELAGPGDDGRPRHVTGLLPAIERAVAATGGWPAIGVVAVGTGPGTFTGLRVGISTARSLAQGRAIPIAGISSLAVLGIGIGETPEADGRSRLAVIDARRSEAFAALYGADGREVWPPFVATPDELCRRLEAAGEPVVAAGDGSLRFRDRLEDAGATVLAAADEAHLVRARHLCRLAAAVEPGAPETIEPIYLRRPDAELWRERDRGPDKTG